jgi:hypothetical protein
MHFSKVVFGGQTYPLPANAAAARPAARPEKHPKHQPKKREPMTIPTSTDLANFVSILQTVRCNPIQAAITIFSYAKAHGAPQPTFTQAEFDETYHRDLIADLHAKNFAALAETKGAR